jgi:hypothetical protein
MQLLERRLEALERKTDGDGGPLMVLISLISPGHLDAPRVRAECDGSDFARSPEEQEDEFVARVKSELLVTKPGRPAYRVLLYGSEA